MDLLFIILIFLVFIGIVSVFIVVKVDKKISNKKDSISEYNNKE